MAKQYRIPDFKKMYPEASEEVIAVLRTTERKMQYQEYDLKVQRSIFNKKNNTMEVIPSREDSYERLQEQEVPFAETGLGTEELVIQNLQFEQLHKAISRLSEDEQYLIKQLFFEERTERDLAAEYHLSQKAINKRRQKILKKLKDLLKDF